MQSSGVPLGLGGLGDACLDLDQCSLVAGGGISISVNSTKITQNALPPSDGPPVPPKDFVLTNWLSKADYRPVQLEIFSKVDRNTGDWLLSSEEYNQWVSQRFKRMYGTGMLGSGKTYLSSIIVDNLQRHFRNDDQTVVLYIYCRYDDSYTISELLGALLRQAAEKSQHIYKYIENKCHLPHGQHSMLLQQSDYALLLEKVASRLKRTFVVVDGLNELGEHSAGQLVNILASLNVSLLVTSRSPDILEKALSGARKFIVHVPNEEIIGFIKAKIQKDPGLQYFVTIRPHFINKIINKIMETWTGQYLLVRFQVDSLKRGDVVEETELQRKLESIPKNLEESFQQTFERLLSDKAHMNAQIKRIILWMTCAYEELTLNELREAIMLHPQSSIQDLGCMFWDVTLISGLNGILSIKGQSVRFVHRAAQEYFKKNISSIEENPNDFISSLCTNYLTICGIHNCRTLVDFGVWVRSRPLIPYTYKWWTRHAKSCEQGIPVLVKDFIKQTPYHPLYIVDRSAGCGGNQPTGQFDIFRPINVAATYGHIETVGHLLDSCNEQSLLHRKTALHIACSYRDVPLVKLLLAVEDVNIWAAAKLKGQDSRSQAEAAPADSFHHTIATFSDHPEERRKQLQILELLLERADADPYAWSNIAKPLHNICTTILTSWGREDTLNVLKLLIPRINNTISCDDAGVVLYAAAKINEDRLVKELLDIGVSSSYCGESGTPLELARNAGYSKVVEVITAYEQKQQLVTTKGGQSSWMSRLLQQLWPNE